MTDDDPTPQAKSLHDRIRDDLEDRILSGTWPPGHKVPSELELSEEYSCSRMTVNKVMTQLAAAGLILRRRRAGSVVLPQKSQNAVLEIHDVKDEVLSRGGWYRYDILSRDAGQISDEPLADGLDDTGPILVITCLHFSDDIPFCFEERIIFLSAVPEAETEAFEQAAPVLGCWAMSRGARPRTRSPRPMPMMPWPACWGSTPGLRA